MSALDEYAEIVLGCSVFDHPLNWAIAYERIYWVRIYPLPPSSLLLPLPPPPAAAAAAAAAACCRKTCMTRFNSEEKLQRHLSHGCQMTSERSKVL